MSPEVAQLAPLIVITPLLAAMAWNDLKNLKISNKLVMMMLAAFVLSAPVFLSFHETVYRAVFGVGVFVVGFLGFTLRLWGGGDVKAIAALTLFVPSYCLLLFFYTFTLSMVVGMMFVITSRSIIGFPECRWLALRPKAGYPMGVSIAMSGVLLPLVAMGLG
ncbi:prepilin peptidase [Ruegeria atlantica]|uniref:prepilin peptidase n=1 Tax=Ruegeria atlantica TaxID=81569 RepID=UPI00147FB0A0|nr:A24 family peptidase [Ruegeria atlantica]